MKQIACTNCGAKYKLPDSFQSDKAKCKACGSVIDVAAQRSSDPDSAEKPAAAKPAAAKAKPATARRATAKASSDKPRRARAAADDGDEAKPKRKGRTRGAGRSQRADMPPKKNNSMMIGGSILGIAVIVVVLVFMLGGNGDEPANTESTAKDGGDPKAATTENGGPTDADTNSNDTGTPEDASTPNPDDAQPTDAVAEKPKTPKTIPAKPKPSKDPQSKEEVFDPKRDLEELTWPDDIADQAEEYNELVQAVADGGFPALRAKESLQEGGRPAVFAIVNRMRQINYFDLYDTMNAFEFTKVLRAMTKDCYPVPFQMTDEEDVPLAIAHKNALSVRDWHRMATKHAADADAWSALMTKIDEAAKKKASKD